MFRIFSLLALLAFSSVALGQSSNVNSTYPPGAIAVTGAFSGADTASASASLAASPGRTTYVCGVKVSGLGATALTNVIATVATVAGGNTLSYQYSMPAGATVVATPVDIAYTPCIPASAQNAAITVTVPGGAGNTSTAIAVYGYQALP